MVGITSPDYFTQTGKPNPENYSVTDYDFADYLKSDFRFLGEEAITIIRNHLDYMKGLREPVILDIFSELHAVRNLAETIFQGKSVYAAAVSRSDNRTPQQKEEDNKLHLTQIQAHLEKPNEWAKIDKWLDLGWGRRRHIDFIFERGVGAHKGMPYNQNFLLTAARHIDRWLSPHGLLVLQTAPRQDLERLGMPVQSWLDAMGQHGYRTIKRDSYGGDRHIFQPFGLLLAQKR